FQAGFRERPILLVFYMKCFVVIHKEKMIFGLDIHVSSSINPVNTLFLKLLFSIWENLSANQQKWGIGFGQLINPGKLMGPDLFLYLCKKLECLIRKMEFYLCINVMSMGIRLLFIHF